MEAWGGERVDLTRLIQETWRFARSEVLTAQVAVERKGHFVRPFSPSDKTTPSRLGILGVSIRFLNSEFWFLHSEF